MSIARRAQRDQEIDALDKEIEELEKARTKDIEEGSKPKDEEENLPDPSTVEETTYKKRYADLRRYNQEVKNDLEKKISQLMGEIEELKKAPSNPIPTTEAQIKEWANKNPQAAAIIRAIAKEQAGSDPQLKQLRSEIEEIEKLKKSVSEDRVKARILKIHPDFDDIKEDDAFHDWAETQPRILQSAIYDSNDPDDIISVINLYKKEKGIKALNPEKEAAKAVKTSGTTPPTTDKGKGRFTESIVKKMSDKEFEKYEQEIYEEMRTNPYFFDISGGAR